MSPDKPGTYSHCTGEDDQYCDERDYRTTELSFALWGRRGRVLRCLRGLRLLRRLWLLRMARVVGLSWRWGRRTAEGRLRLGATASGRGGGMRALIRARCLRAVAQRRWCTETTGRAGVIGAATRLTKARAGSAKSGVSPGVSWWCT